MAIARALVNDPHVILADEPTGNLDSATSDEIMQMLEALNAAGKTIIMVTHENDIAARARRTVRMRDGLVESAERGTRHAEREPKPKPLAASLLRCALHRLTRSGRQQCCVEYRLDCVSRREVACPTAHLRIKRGACFDDQRLAGKRMKTTVEKAIGRIDVEFAVANYTDVVLCDQGLHTTTP